jgi:mgtE-like transporter
MRGEPLLEITRSFFSRNKSVFSLGLVALMISSLGDLLAGITLGSMTGTLQLLPGLMILIPPAIGMRGNVYGALGSRLGTSMHIGTFELSYRKGSILRSNMESSLLLTLVMSVLMGILAKIVAGGLGIATVPFETFIFISVLGGVLAGLVLILINILVASLGFRRNWDIDNISAPLITAAGDVVTLPMLFLAAIIVMAAPGWAIAVIAVAFLAFTVYLTYLALSRGADEARRIFVHSSPVLTLCILLDIVAGVTIDQQLESLVALPALLILIPPFLEDANALGGILTSRFSSTMVFLFAVL